MIEHFASQGSPEWKQARAGCITASNFNLIRSSNKLKTGPRKGQYGDKALNYAFRLAVERISGAPLDEGYETWAMERGHELEPMARMCHEERTGDIVREVGFVSTDDGKFGASADGFLSNGNGCEYKCFVSPEKLRAILLDDDLSEVIDQTQGGMWLTGAKAWEFGLYCPALAPVGREFTLIVISRDESFIESLEDDLIAFERVVTQYEDKLRATLAGQGDIFAPAPAAGDPAPASILGLVNAPAPAAKAAPIAAPTF